MTEHKYLTLKDRLADVERISGLKMQTGLTWSNHFSAINTLLKLKTIWSKVERYIEEFYFTKSFWKFGKVQLNICWKSINILTLVWHEKPLWLKMC